MSHVLLLTLEVQSIDKKFQYSWVIWRQRKQCNWIIGTSKIPSFAFTIYIEPLPLPNNNSLGEWHNCFWHWKSSWLYVLLPGNLFWSVLISQIAGVLASHLLNTPLLSDHISKLLHIPTHVCVLISSFLVNKKQYSAWLVKSK